MKMLTVISHTLMEEQIEEAKNRLKVDSIVSMPEDINNIWSNISPFGCLPTDQIESIVKWIEKESNKGDYVLIQGDFGATYYIVDYCIKNSRIPIYATTERQVEEYINDGAVEVKRIFKHVNFRKYIPYDYTKEV